jgi:type IX secretion system PorP/SprF family membrane protein
MPIPVHAQRQPVFFAHRIATMRAVILLMAVFCFCVPTWGQDISMFTQKISNGFLFNPSAAGAGHTQLLLSYRNNYSGADGAPNNNYLSFNSSLQDGKFGIGFNLIHDKSTLLTSTFFSTAFAYHIKFNDEASLSMGIAGELSTLRLSDELLNQNNGRDVIINQFKAGGVTPDISAGVTFRTRFFNARAAINHLSTSWNEAGAVNQFTRYFTASLVGLIPMADGVSRFEPYLNYRNYFRLDQIVDLGLYYNHNRAVIFGLGARNFKMASVSIGTMPLNGIFIGYSREQAFGSIGRYLGSTNEVIVRANLYGKNSDQYSRFKVEDVDSKKLMYKVKKRRGRKK